MKEFKGTKSPWSIEKGKKNGYKISGKSWGSFCKVHELNQKFSSDLIIESNKESKANAKLIAAAPELLKACVNALESFELFVKDGYIMDNTISHNLIKEAINKALD